MRHLMLLLCAACTAASAAEDPLAEHAWRHRVLVLHAAPGDTAAVERFRERVRRRRCGIDDRDLVTGALTGPETGRLDGEALAPERVRALRRRLAVDADATTTVLVGKDGGVKMRVDGVADLDAVFRRIDGMPMRRREMAERGPPDCG